MLRMTTPCFCPVLVSFTEGGRREEGGGRERGREGEGREGWRRDGGMEGGMEGE